MRLLIPPLVALACTSLAHSQVLQANPAPANNGLTTLGMAIFFDLTAAASDVTVTHAQVAASPVAGTAFDFEVFVRDGTGLGTAVATGPGSSPFGWRSLGIASTVQGAAGSSGLLDQTDIPDIFVPAGQTVGVAFRTTLVSGFRYKTGVVGMYNNFSDANLSLRTGDARSTPFIPAGAFNSPRELVGNLTYVLGGTPLPPPPTPIDVAIVDCLPGSWIDISATGTALNLLDDDAIDIPTTVGNALLAAGVARVGSNGAIRFDGLFPTLSGVNAALPSTAFLSDQALFPFWDDIDTVTGTVGNIYWQEVGGTLVVQWENVGFFTDAVNRATFQVQVHSTGPAFAQFLYEDVEQPRADGGGSATIGYQNGFGPGGNHVQYAFSAHYAVRNGAVLSLVDRMATSVFITDSVPGTFIDISATGAPLNLADDGSAAIPTTVGNALLASGAAQVGSNGGVRFGGPGTSLAFTNAAIPSASAFGLTSQSLLPFWDDVNTVGGTVGNVYWQEIGDTLIIQWENVGFFGQPATERATFQVQVFSSGPVVAQYLYEDVEGVRAASGASATVGYQSGGLVGNDAQWSFNVASVVDGDVLSVCYANATVGTEYCIAVANSTGEPARLFGTGSTSLLANDLVLNVTDLPANSFGYFARGTATANTPLAAGGMGTLCIGGTVARGVGGAVVNSGAEGSVSLLANLPALPTSAGGTVSATVGQTIWLQYWYRDFVAGMTTSNLSNALQVRVTN
jgi:hypothetical protein